MLILTDGSIWVLKGCYHPLDGYVAIPRVFEGIKLKTLRKSLEVVRKYYRHFLRYVEVIGDLVPVVPLDYVVKYLDSLSFKPQETHSELLNNALDLLELLKGCGLTCGLSGSLLGGYSGAGSDIDLTCLEGGITTCDVYECLKMLREENVLKPMDLTSALREVYEIKELLNVDTHVTFLRGRLTQGMFKGFNYTLRVVNCGREANVLGPYDLTVKSEVLIRTLTTDYRTPSVYEVQLLKPKNPLVKRAFLHTYRVRLTELPEGTLIYGYGRVSFKTGRDVEAVVSFDSEDSQVISVV